MSRIGNNPVSIPKGVQVKLAGKSLSAKGPQGSLSFEIPTSIECTIDKDVISFVRPDNDRKNRALHGMARAITANMMTGCSVGFTRVLEIVGVGYRAQVKGSAVDLTLGFSHPVSYQLPDGVKAEISKEGKLSLFSANKSLLGQVAADIRRWRPPEPYKGKGIRYLDEQILRKEGKARGKK